MALLEIRVSLLVRILFSGVPELWSQPRLFQSSKTFIPVTVKRMAVNSGGNWWILSSSIWEIENILRILQNCRIQQELGVIISLIFIPLVWISFNNSSLYSPACFRIPIRWCPVDELQIGNGLCVRWWLSFRAFTGYPAGAKDQWPYPVQNMVLVKSPWLNDISLLNSGS